MNITLISHYGLILQYSITNYYLPINNTSSHITKSSSLINQCVPKWEIILALQLIQDIRNPILYILNPNYGLYLTMNYLYTNTRIIIYPINLYINNKLSIQYNHNYHLIGISSTSCFNRLTLTLHTKLGTIGYNLMVNYRNFGFKPTTRIVMMSYLLMPQ